MNLEQLDKITRTSAEEVDELAEIRNSMDSNDFNLLAYQEFSRYIHNSQVVNMMVDTSNNTYELLRLLKMKSDSWYSKAIESFCTSFREAISLNDLDVIEVVEKEYPEVDKCLQNYHDSFFLQNQHLSDNHRHIVRAYFRMMGDTLESVHFPLLQFIYKILIITPSSALYERPQTVSNGKVLSELVGMEVFNIPFKEWLHGVPLNQWRNISSHSSYKYEKVSDSIECNYGNNLTVTLTFTELEKLMVKMDILQSLLKICVEFPILEFTGFFKLVSNMEVTEEAIFSRLGTALSLTGYTLHKIKKYEDRIIIQVQDINGRAPDLHEKDANLFLHPLLLFKHNGLDAEIEFFDSTGKSAKKLFIQINDG